MARLKHCALHAWGMILFMTGICLFDLARLPATNLDTMRLNPNK
jgi:hypothetical protein